MIGKEFAFPMKFISDEDLNEDYASFENLASVRVRIAFRNSMSLKRRTKNRNDIIVGLLWGGTSNQS